MSHRLLTYPCLLLAHDSHFIVRVVQLDHVILALTSKSDTSSYSILLIGIHFVIFRIDCRRVAIKVVGILSLIRSARRMAPGRIEPVSISLALLTFLLHALLIAKVGLSDGTPFLAATSQVRDRAVQ